MDKQTLDDEYLTTAMDTLEVVESGQCTVTLDREFTAACPYDDLMDTYELTIRYEPIGGHCLELRSLGELLDTLSGVKAGQEAICQFLGDVLFTHLGPAWIEVELSGTHYGIETTTTRRRDE